MECHVPRANLKAISNAFLCLGKIGKEVFLEMAGDELVLRTLNDSKSAFAEFAFRRSCFEYLHPPPEDEPVRCKFFVKACQNVFRSLRSVEVLKIYFEHEEVNHFLVFQLCCRFGIVKTHRVVYEDCNIFAARVDRDLCPTSLTARPATLGRLVEHIQGTDEVSLLISASEVKISSYHQNLNAEAARSTLKTALSVAPTEFERFEYGCERSAIDITFVLREFKAMLAFCMAPGVEELTLYCSASGAPVLFTTDGIANQAYVAELVLATVQTEWEDSQPSRGASGTDRSATSSVASRANSVTGAKRPRPRPDDAAWASASASDASPPLASTTLASGAGGGAGAGGSGGYDKDGDVLMGESAAGYGRRTEPTAADDEVSPAAAKRARTGAPDGTNVWDAGDVSGADAREVVGSGAGAEDPTGSGGGRPSLGGRRTPSTARLARRLVGDPAARSNTVAASRRSPGALSGAAGAKRDDEDMWEDASPAPRPGGASAGGGRCSVTASMDSRTYAEDEDEGDGDFVEASQEMQVDGEAEALFQ